MGRFWHVCTASLIGPSALAGGQRGLEVDVHAIGPASAIGTAESLALGPRYAWYLGPDVRRLPLERAAYGRRGTVRVTLKALPASPHPEIQARGMEDGETEPNQRMGGTQAIMRAVDILMAVADGPISLPDLVEKVGIPKPTCHRIATALADRGLLLTSGRSGYRLGPMLKELARRSET